MPKLIFDTLPFYTSRFRLRLLAYQTALVKKARRTPRNYQVIGYKFKAHNQTVGRSAKTAQQYNKSLNPATDGCRAEGCPPTWTTWGEDEVREFILYNQDRRGLWKEIVLHIRESEERASDRFHLDVPREQHRGAPAPRTEASGRYRKGDRTLNPRANR